MTTAVEPIRVRPHVSEPSSKRRRTSSSGMERYQIFNRISEGAYGVVYRAWDKEKDELVAMKHEFHGFSQSTQREIAVLKSLPRHRNIVNLKNVVVDASQRVFVVMEYFPFDLKRFMDDKPKPYFAMAEVKSMMRQILQGVEFLHANGVMHRDLKPSNILVDREGNVKICDFGLSRRLESSRSGACTPGMVTLWYRAPEILAGAASYTSAVDMWSVGCIMAEVAMKKVLFRGTSEIDQLRRVRWFMEQPCPDYLLQRLTEGASAAGVTWLTPRGFDLLRRLLALDPNGRITAKEALRHGWFKEK